MKRFLVEVLKLAAIVVLSFGGAAVIARREITLAFAARDARGAVKRAARDAEHTDLDGRVKVLELAAKKP